MSVTLVSPQPLVGPTAILYVPLGASALRSLTVDRTRLENLKAAVAAAEADIAKKERQLREGPKPGTRGFYVLPFGDTGRRFYCTVLSREQACRLDPAFATYCYDRDDIVFILDTGGGVSSLWRKDFTPETQEAAAS